MDGIYKFTWKSTNEGIWLCQMGNINETTFCKIRKINLRAKKNGKIDYIKVISNREFL